MKYCKYIYPIVLFLCFVSCKTQEEEEEEKVSLVQTSWEKYNLKGKVKAVTTSFERFYPSTLSKDKIREYEHRNNLDNRERIPMGKYIFSKYGFLKKSYRRYQDSIFNIGFVDRRNTRDVYLHFFDSLDYQRKKKIKGKYKYPFPVYNPYVVYVNRKAVKERDIKKDSSQFLYEAYDYFAQQGKIIQKKYYVSFEPIEEDDKEKELMIRTEYVYNNEGLIIAQNAFYWEAPAGVIYLYDDIMHLSLAVKHRSDKKYEYTYDDKNRILQVKLFVNGNMAWRENYSYKKNSRRPYKLDRFIWSGMTYGTFYTNNSTEWYNQYGDITKSVNYENEDNVVRTRFYDYTYDDTGNWVQCKMYLKGESERTEKPTMIANRNITYYSEKDKEDRN